MPKILLNPYRNNLSLAGITHRHDTLLDQSVRRDSDVVFHSMVVGDLTAAGNITFTGNITEVETEHLTIKDNIIDVNAGNETPLMTGGISIQRGPGLVPFDILYNESQRLLKVGLGASAMRAVATREDDPVNNWLAVWNQSMSRFDTTNELTIPLNLNERLTLNDVLSFGPTSGTSNQPPVLYRVGNDLVIDSPSGNVIFPGLPNAESKVTIPFNRILAFEQSSLKADTAGTGIIVTTETLAFSDQAVGRIAWPAASSSIWALDDTLHIEGSAMAVRATNGVHFDCPEVTHGVATFTTLPGGSYQLTSAVDFQFTSSSSLGTVDVPALSLNAKRASITTDSNGNTSLNASGNLFLNPQSSVLINSGKRVSFAGTGVALFTNLADFQIENANGALLLSAASKVAIPSGVTLTVGSGTILSENLSSFAATLTSMSSDVALVPGPGKAVQIAAGTAVNFGGQPIFGTLSGDIYISPTGFLTLAASLAVRVPTGTPLIFGEPSATQASRIYKDATGNLCLENDRAVNVSAIEGVSITNSRGISVGSNAGRLYEEVDGSLTLAGGTGHPVVKSKTSFLVEATAIATTSGTSSLGTLGGVYIGGNLLVQGPAALQETTIGGNIIMDGNATIPIRVSNASLTNGLLFSLSSQWDTTPGYTVGRGTPSQGGGRAMVFTVPSYSHYGINPRPSFIFASSSGESFMEVCETACTFSAGTSLTIRNASGAALTVAGKSTLSALDVPTTLQAGGSTLVVEPGNGLPGEGSAIFNGTLSIKHSGKLCFEAADVLDTPLLVLDSSSFSMNVPTTVEQQFTSTSSATFAGNVVITGGALDMASGRVTNLALPVDDSDACNLLYVNSVARGNTAKEAVAAATTGPIDLTVPVGTIDDVSIHVGDRVLVRQQNDPVENGLYIVSASGMLARTPDLASGQNAKGSSVFVTGGTVNGTTGFVVVGSNPVVGTDALTWTPFSGASMIQAGTGISKVGNAFSIRSDGVSIGADTAGNVKVRDQYFSTGLTIAAVGTQLASVQTSSDQSHVTKVGNIVAGEWKASTVAVPYGGTGASSFHAHAVITGNGTSALTANPDLFYSNGRLGLGTQDPQAQLHVMGPVDGVATGTWLKIQDGASSVSMPGSSGMIVTNSAGNTAKFSQQGDGTLYIGQEDLTGIDGKIQFSTRQLPRMSISAAGNIVVGGASALPMDGCTFTVTNGSIGTTGGISLGLGGSVNFVGSSATVSATSLENGTLNLSAPVVKVNGELRLPLGSSFNMQGFQVMSGVNGGTDVYSSGTSGVAAPLRFKTGAPPSGSNTTSASATVLADGFLVPKLQIGGTENDRTRAYLMEAQPDGSLTMGPGTSGRSLTFKGPVQCMSSLTFSNNADVSKAVNLFLDGGTLYVQPSFSATSDAYAGHGIVLGGGHQDIITTIGNRDLSNYVRYDPTVTSALHPGGVLSVSQGVLSNFAGPVQLASSLQFAVGNGVEGLFTASGWYYLGTLGTGRTVLGVPGAWTLRLQYDGSNPYSTTLLLSEATGNAANLVIYITSTGVYELFINTVSAPCRFSVYQSPTLLSLSRYEGGGVVPSGVYSTFNDTNFHVDYDLNSAQSNANIQAGSLNIIGTTRLNNTTLTGNSQVTGDLDTRGNATFTGREHVFKDPFTNLPGVTIEHVKPQQSSGALHNRVVIHGATASGSVPSLGLRKGGAHNDTVSFSIVSDDSNTLTPGSLNIGHQGHDGSSQIALSTQEKPRVVLGQQGTLTVQSADGDDDTVTLVNSATATATMNVLGSARFAKRVVAQEVLIVPEVRLGSANSSSGSTVVLMGDATGNVRVSTISGARARLRGLETPVDPDDAATRAFVESLVQGLSPKESVAAASVGLSVDLTSVVTTLDGVLLNAGQRILVKDNVPPVDNGIYTIQNGAPPVRAEDLKVGANASAVFVFVSSGDVNGSSGWVCTASAGHANVGTNDMLFTQFSGAGHITAGLGLSKNGNQLRVLFDGTSIEAGGNKSLRLSSGAAGTGLSGGSGLPLYVSSISHLDTLGTIRSGTWNAGAIGMAWGGTGATNFAVGRIPFSNGLSLTQGKLFFDEVNVRLGINTITPTSGLTVEDRDIHLIATSSAMSPAAATSLMFTASVANQSFAMRNTGSSFIISAGTGANKLTLTDILALDSNGSLTLKRELHSKAVNVGPGDTSLIRWDADGLARTASGPLIWNMYSADNSGASISFYGGLGVPNDRTNSESMRVGFYNGSYVVGTTASGTGAARNLLLQSAGNVDQLLVRTDGSTSMSGPLFLSSTSAGALTVSGGGSFAGTLQANTLRVTGTAAGGNVLDIAGNTNVQGTLTVKVPVRTASQTSVNSAFSIGCDVDTGGLCMISNSTEAIASISTQTANNAGPAALKIFGFGNVASESSEYVNMGFDAQNLRYEIRTVTTGAGIVRPLLLSAAGAARDQLQLSSDGSITFRGSVYAQGTLSINDLHDATSSLGVAAANVAGGLAVGKSIYAGVAVQSPLVRVTTSLQLSNAGSLDNVSLAYTSAGNVHMYGDPSFALNLHTGASLGPKAPSTAQEKMIFGHVPSLSSTAHAVLGTRPQLILSAGAATRLVTLDDGSINSSGNAGVFVAGSVTCQSSIVQSNAEILGNLSVLGLHSIGSLTGNAGKMMSLKGAGSELAFFSKGAGEISMQTDGTVSVSRPSDGAVFLSIDTSGSGLAKLSCPVTIQSSGTSASSFAFQIVNGGGNRVFSFSSVDHTLDLTGGRVTNSASPILAGDLCNKSYVDNLVKGLNLKAAVTAAADANVDLLRPVLLIDAVALVPDARVLLMGQTNRVENGIYTVTAGNYLTRATDFSAGGRSAGAFTFVQQGQYKGDKGYVCIADFPQDVIGQNQLHFSQFNGNMISAGIGLYKDGNNVMNILLASQGSALSFDANGLRVDASIAGKGLAMDVQTGVINMEPITEIADVTRGRYMATVIDVPFGGTGNDGFAEHSIVYSDGEHLVSDANLFSWNAAKRVLGLNGIADPNNLNDGLTVYERDVYLLGEQPSFLFGSTSNITDTGAVINTPSYNWRMRKQDAPRLGNVRDIPNGAWNAVVLSQQGDVGIVQGEPGSPTYITRDGGYQFDVIDALSEGVVMSWGETSISSDGGVILCCGLQDYLYISRDNGRTFNCALTDQRRGWEWTDMSLTGQYMLAASIGTGVFRSADAGVSWHYVDGTLDYIIGFVHVIKSGSVQFIGYWGGGVLISRDYGATFSEHTSLPHKRWWDIAEASDSGTLALYACPGYFYLSDDAGLTWQANFTDQARDWNSGSISANGTVIAGTIENGTTVYVSTDRGLTLNAVFTSATHEAWMFALVTNDGSAVFAGGRNIPVSGANLLLPTGDPVNPFPVFPVSNGSVDVQSAHLTSDEYLFYPNNGARVHRYNYSHPSSNLIFSGGQSPDKVSLTDTLIMTARQYVGIGYAAENSADISSTLDVFGTMQVSGPVQFDTPLSTVSGGTGANDLPYGLVIAGGYSKPYFSTGLFPPNGVPVGNADGTISLLSGPALRDAIGLSSSQVQTQNDNLDAISSLTPANGTFIVGNGSAFAGTTVAQVSTLLNLGSLSQLSFIDNSNWNVNGADLSVANGGTGTSSFVSGSYPWYDGGKLTSGSLREDTTTASVRKVRLDACFVVSNTVNNSASNSNVSLLGNTSVILGTEASAGGAVSHAWSIGRDAITNDFLLNGTNSTAGSTYVTDLLPRLRISALDGSVSLGKLIASAGLTVPAGPVSVTNQITAGSLRVLGTTNLQDITAAASLSITGAVTFSSTLSVTGAINTSSQVIGTGTTVIQRDSTVGACAAGLTVASDQGGTYSSQTVITNAMRHLSLISNVSGASTTLSMRNIFNTAAARGWDIVVDGSTANGNKLIFQSASVDPNSASAPLQCFSLDAVSGAMIVGGTASISGAVACGAALSAQGNLSVNGTLISLSPASSSSTATLALTVAGNNANLALDPSGTATLSNSGGGALAVKARGSKGLAVAADSGDVTTDGKVVVSSTVDASSYTNGGALTVKGGAAVAGSVFVQGSITVAGAVKGLNFAVDAVLQTSAADMVNVSQLTVKSSRLITLNNQIMLTATFKITPTAGNTNTIFTFSLPGRTTALTERLDLDTAQCSGFSDNVNLIVLQNILCTGVAGATKAIVQFQSTDTTLHYLQVLTTYRSG